MVMLKGRELENFIKSPPPDASMVLIFGPDTGLASERAKKLTSAATSGSSDPFALITLEASEVAADPNRLADEALQIAMFGDKRTVWVRGAGGQNLTAAVDPLLADPPRDSLVVIEAGDLKKGTALRKRFETDKKAVAIACYADAAGDLDRLIDEETQAAGLTIDRDARQALHSLIGADRLASRSEVNKLCLYALGAKSITIDDVMAIVGDASALAVDELTDAVFLGDLDGVVRSIRRLASGGMSPAAIGTVTLRHLQMLHRARAEVDAGSSPDSVVAGFRPPIFFRRRPIVARTIGQWSTIRLEHAMSVLNGAILASRNMPDLAEAALCDALLTIGRAARRRG